MKITLFATEKVMGKTIQHAHIEKGTEYVESELEKYLDAQFISVIAAQDGDLFVDYYTKQGTNRLVELNVEGIRKKAPKTAWEEIQEKAINLNKALASTGREMTLAKAVVHICEVHPELYRKYRQENQ